MTLLMRFVNLALGLVLAAAGVQDFRWSGGMSAGQALEIKGVNGNIQARGGSGDVVVTAHKHGRRSDPSQVEVRVVPHAGGTTICAVYPGRNGQANSCTPGPGGHMETGDNDVNVDFDIQLPADVRLIARTVNGNVEAEAIESAVEAATVNGDVRLATDRGDARAETVNGNIEAQLGGEAPQAPLEFKTVNGNVQVRVPEGASADVEARTVNGSIVSDFPLPVEGKWGPRRMHGRLGSGGQRLSLSSVNGSVRLEKR